MNKKFAAILVSTLVLTSCVTSASAKTPQINADAKTITTTSNSVSLIDNIVSTKQFNARNLTLTKNTTDISKAVNKTMKTIGKTWYVFSGSTPAGWDCSGLVLWTYAHLDIDLYHSATAQMKSGREVSIPKYGDIVGFKYNNGSMFYHVGIYISDDLMLHSGGKRGDKTELRSISDFAGSYSKVSYSRLVDTH